MLPKLQHKVTSIWSGVMKYKVLKDYPTTDGVLYEKEIVKDYNPKSYVFEDQISFNKEYQKK